MDVPRVLLAACVVAGLVGASVLPVGKLPGDPGTTSGTSSAYGAAMVALSGVARPRPLDHRPGLVALEHLYRVSCNLWSPARTTGRTWPPTRSA